jgi:hypothetical protein
MKRILRILLIVILLGIAIAYYLYQKPTELVSTGSPDYEYSIETVVEKGVSESDTLFNKLHVGKKVMLTGLINAKSIQKSGSTVFFETENENVIVAAAFDPSMNQALEDIKLGNKVEIMCICNGIAKPEDSEDLLSETTLSFNRCSLLDSKTQN